MFGDCFLLTSFPPVRLLMQACFERHKCFRFRHSTNARDAGMYNDWSSMSMVILRFARWVTYTHSSLNRKLKAFSMRARFLLVKRAKTNGLSVCKTARYRWWCAAKRVAALLVNIKKSGHNFPLYDYRLHPATIDWTTTIKWTTHFLP